MSVRYCIERDNKYLNASDEFKSPVIIGRPGRIEGAHTFASEAEALAKAEALGLDLERIIIVKVTRDEDARSRAARDFQAKSRRS